MLTPARLSVRDRLHVGATGLRTRPMRAFLSALGIAIGIAAMVAVVGISGSSRAQLDRALDTLGTNLLTVAPGPGLAGGNPTLPSAAAGMVGRIGPVESVSSIGEVPEAKVYRNEHIPAAETNAIGTYATALDLPATVGATVADGQWLTRATARYPAVVLGAKAAERLGITTARPDVQILVGGRRATVVGILAPAPLAPELDSAVLLGHDAATRYFGFDGHPTTIYTRAREDAVHQVRDVLAATANPERPYDVAVSRPSDALAAQHAADQAFTGLLLGLGAVALLVGGIGVANTMVISVLERRAEIGLRRALGATRGQVRGQFLSESLLLSALGGAAGAVLGMAVTACYALVRGWPTVVPPWVLAGGVLATLAVGGLAGLYPATRAARLDPTTALATT
ncbi:ABC transporter permease [Actinophytocola sediminis]